MFGVGLRHQHFPHLLSALDENLESLQVNWFEGITENFFDTQGRPLQVLEKVRRDFPVGLHGVSLSIASSEDLNMEYLKKVKALYQRIDPVVVSDHLCWTGHRATNLHNLLPIAYNEESLNYLIPRIQKVQEFLGRQLSLENLSAYFDLKTSTMTEWVFLKLLAEKSGCKLLLDINNVYVNSQNHGFDPKLYLDAIPNALITEVHLAGFSDMGTHLFDTHSCPVWDPVWDLYVHKIKSGLKVPVLVEWDEDIPDYPVLEAEMLKARNLFHEVSPG
jgi:uncharacterized protein (UPF0276 family)